MPLLASLGPLREIPLPICYPGRMRISRWILFTLFSLLVVASSCGTPAREYDVVIRNGTIYDGSGQDPVSGDLAIDSDMIAAVGDLGNAVGKVEIEADGTTECGRRE